MKSILENGAKAFGLFSLFLVVLTTAHDWAFFNALGSKLQSIQTAYDYIANAIEWIPFFLGLLIWGGIGAAVGVRLFGSSSSDEREFGFEDQRKRAEMPKFAKLLLGMGALGVAIFLVSLFLYFPLRQIFYGSSVVCILVSFILWIWAKELVPFSVATLAGIISAIILLYTAYISGTNDAAHVLSGKSDIYFVKIKDDTSKAAALLRSFEKGILVWNSEGQTVEFFRWEKVESVSRTIEVDRSPVCFLFGKFCRASSGVVVSPPSKKG
jgi:hypothetical protein